MTESIGLTARIGEAPVLEHVHAIGRIEGLLLQMELRQHYRNTGSAPLETVYTFPLAWGATLLGLMAQLGQQCLHGRVVARAEAAETYENAIVEGDTPVLVEDNGNGLFTAQLGNLLPGETAILTVRYAQPLHITQGQVRITLPTTVAPRFGDPHTQGGMPAHASVQSALQAEHGFKVQVDVVGSLAAATLSSPSHAVEVQARTDGLRLHLRSDAWLDRDLVLLLEHLPDQSFTVCSHDPDGGVSVLASFHPAIDAECADQALRLKLLVDCSGSMAGSSIEQARAALLQVLAQLEDRDQVSYSRFGGPLHHDTGALQACTPAQRRALASAIAQTEADLGGTQMRRAIEGVVGLADAEGSVLDADLLLITDGSVWDIDRMVDLVRSANHRIFAIGVGSAPGESLLRQLAEASGGACELVSPSEDMAAAVLRMFGRLRGARACDLRLIWPEGVRWQAPLPRALHAGDTLHVHARLDGLPSAGPVLSWRQGEHARQALSAPPLPQLQPDDTLARLVGAQELAACRDAEQQVALAVRHQLVCAHASLVLVHQRAAGEKPLIFPQVHEVQHMHAVGSHGLGSMPSAVRFSMPLRDAHPSALRERVGDTQFMRMHASEPVGEPQFLRSYERSDDHTHKQHASAEALRDRALLAAAAGASLADLDTQLRPLEWPYPLKRLLRWLDQRTGKPEWSMRFALHALLARLEPGVALTDLQHCNAELLALLLPVPPLPPALLAELEARCVTVANEVR